MSDLLDQGVSAGFHLAAAIRDASSAEDRARILLQVPDQVLSAMFVPIDRACAEREFELGRRYIIARMASFSARRTPAGDLPETIEQDLDLVAGFLRQLAGVAR